MNINFDNSAGTFPKPESVRRAVANAMRRYGGNPGRGGHRLSQETAEQVYRVRKLAADFFGAEPENTAFTPNCTYGLNMAIKGIMQFGGHMIISSMEHNAVSRPVYSLTRRSGVKCSVADLCGDPERDISVLEGLIRHDTLCICCTAASNVTGRILPFREIGDLCRRRNIAFICDCAQGAGILDLGLKDGIDFICTSGQKGLYGPTGTGFLVSSGRFPLSTIIEGGTGATSAELAQTPFMPEKLESGSLNTAGIIGAGAGIEFVTTRTPEKIRSHEAKLCKRLEEGLLSISSDIRIFDADKPRAPIVSFLLPGESSEETAQKLNGAGFSLRGGLQCAALAHESLGTISTGTVRFSPSVFNDLGQTDRLLNVIDGIMRKKKAH
ncbi:MAG: aminotransferase class V-fold PLP-dependent enzyme [Ruminococcus sp.]|nr:aminotransferase class V-fold PLP-dependent enzyme [Ruminococcus sp.]